MTLFAIMIALVILQVTGSVDALREHRGGQWLAALAGKIPAGAARLLAVVLVPALIVAGLEYWLYPFLIGIPLFLFQLFILLSCLGRGDFHDDLHSYIRHWQLGDLEEARAVAFRFGSELADDPMISAIDLHDSMRAAVGYRCFERLFAVIFWFAVGGAAGAVLYRLLFVAASSARVSGEDRSLATRCLYFVEWVPVRLLAASFALAGNFDRCTKQFLSIARGVASSSEIIDQCGRAGLSVDVPKGLVDGEEFIGAARIELEDFRALLTRALVVWVVVLALVELF